MGESGKRAGATGAALGGGLALAALGAVGFTALTARKVERVLPPQGRLIAVEGNHLHVIDEGEGPPLLLIHGLGGQMRNFTYGLVSALKARFRVVVVERPGSGYSTRAPGASARLSVQADVMAAVIGRLGLERPLVVGHSLGGALALALAIEHPERVGGLALVSPLTAPRRRIPLAFLPLAIPTRPLRWAVAWTLATPVALLGRRRMLRQLFGPEPEPGDFALAGGGALGLRPQAFYATSTDLLAINQDLPRLHQRYGELRIPIGVLFGDGDRILDPETNGRALAGEAKGVVYETLPGGGHMIPVTRPDEVAAFIGRVQARMAP